jgi:hypothetical protein
MKEVWKEINGYEGIYLISNLGNVKSLERFVSNHSGFNKKLKEKYRKPSISKTGYYVLDLQKESKRKTFKLHRLIAIAFIENTFNKPCINHKNGNKLDNRIENLEWCTISENNIHAENTKLKNDSGVNNPKSNITENDVYFIRNSKLKLKELSEKFNINQSGISKIKLRKTYKCH